MASLTFSAGFEILVTIILIFLYFYIKDGLKSPRLALVPVLIGLIFAYINVRGAKDFALIYLLFVVLALLIGFLKTGFPGQGTTTEIANIKFSGPQYTLLIYGLGFFMLIIMFGIQQLTSSLIIGVPLSTNGFGTIGSVMSAISENWFFATILLPLSFVIKPLWQFIAEKLQGWPLIGIFLVQSVVVLLTLAIPFLLVAYLFGVFHVTAYSQRVAGIVFAASVMLLWLISYKLTESTTPMDVAHIGWNFPIALKQAGLVIGGAS